MLQCQCRRVPCPWVTASCAVQSFYCCETSTRWRWTLSIVQGSSTRFYASARDWNSTVISYNSKFTSHAYIGRPPVTRIIVSRKIAGRKWTKMAEMRNMSRLDTNFRWGYQTADFNGNLCRYPFTFVWTIRQRNGLYALEVQWKIWSSRELKSTQKFLIQFHENFFPLLVHRGRRSNDQNLIDHHVNWNVIADQVHIHGQPPNDALRSSHEESLGSVLRDSPSWVRFLPAADDHTRTHDAARESIRVFVDFVLRQMLRECVRVLLD